MAPQPLATIVGLTSQLFNNSSRLRKRLRNGFKTLFRRHEAAEDARQRTMMDKFRDWLIVVMACLSVPSLIYTIYSFTTAKYGNRIAAIGDQLAIKQYCSSNVSRFR